MTSNNLLSNIIIVFTLQCDFKTWRKGTDGDVGRYVEEDSGPRVLFICSNQWGKKSLENGALGHSRCLF